MLLLDRHCSLQQVWFAWTCPGKVCNNVLIISVCSRVTLFTIRSGTHLMNPSFFAPPACERRSEHIPLCVEIPEPVSGLAWRENAWAEWEIPLCAAYKRGRGSQQLFTFPLSTCSSSHFLLGGISGLFCLSAEKWPCHRKAALSCWLLWLHFAFSATEVSAKTVSNSWSGILKSCWCITQLYCNTLL